MIFSGHTARKRFGQHWLKDESVLNKILLAADLQPNDQVLEVGPGKGALTEKLLASRVAGVQAIELDRDLVDGLEKRFGESSKFDLKQGDVLTEQLDFPDREPATKVVANIPYNITGPLLYRLIGRLDKPAEKTYELLVLLLQKEVADRICARPGQKEFNALSVRLQLLASCSRVCNVPPSCFKPPPKVHSAVIALRPKSLEERMDVALAKQVEELLSRAFLERRKMLRNTVGRLRSIEEMDVLTHKVGIDLNKRPQEISPLAWVALARELNLAVEVDS